MSMAWLDVLGSKAGYSLLIDTLANIRDITPNEAVERNAPARLGDANAVGGVDSFGAFASGVGSLTDATA